MSGRKLLQYCMLVLYKGPGTSSGSGNRVNRMTCLPVSDIVHVVLSMCLLYDPFCVNL